MLKPAASPGLMVAELHVHLSCKGAAMDGLGFRGVGVLGFRDRVWGLKARCPACSSSFQSCKWIVSALPACRAVL